MKEAAMNFSSFFSQPFCRFVFDAWEKRVRRPRSSASMAFIATAVAGCCFVTLTTPAHAQSGVIILVGEISAPTCAWDPKLSFPAPATTAQLTRDCRAVPQQTLSQAASRIAQVRETPVGQEFDKKRVLTVAYW